MDSNGFAHKETRYEFPVPEDHEYDYPVEIGRVEEKFSYPREKWETVATIRQYPGESAPMHEFVRELVTSWPRYNMRFAQTRKSSFGQVVCWELPAFDAYGVVLSSAKVSWVSGNCIITISSTYGKVKDLLTLYGSRFPSSLPKKLDLDLTKWYREEVDSALARLEKTIRAASRCGSIGSGAITT